MNSQSATRPNDLAAELRDLLGPHLRPRTFGRGSLLWREGDDSGMLVSLQSGRVKIFRVLPNGNAVTLYLFGPGDTFGFMPLLDGHPYPANAQALTDVQALVMARSDLVRAFESEPRVALALVQFLSRRLRDAFDRIERSAAADVLPRVAASLAALLPDDVSSDLITIELPIRSSEMAGGVGVAPASYSRAVTKLVSAGVLHRLGLRRYQVLDPAKLRRIASSAAP